MTHTTHTHHTHTHHTQPQVGETLTVTCSGTYTSDMSGYPTVNAFLNGVDIGGGTLSPDNNDMFKLI